MMVWWSDIIYHHIITMINSLSSDHAAAAECVPVAQLVGGTERLYM